MDERGQSRLASVITLAVGIWVAISPIWLAVSGGALASIIATGCFIGVVSIIQFFWRNVVPSWLTGLAAIWLFIGLFVFDGLMSGGMLLSGVLSAIAVFLLSIWDGAEVSQVEHNPTVA